MSKQSIYVIYGSSGSEAKSKAAEYRHSGWNAYVLHAPYIKGEEVVNFFILTSDVSDDQAERLRHLFGDDAKELSYDEVPEAPDYDDDEAPKLPVSRKIDPGSVDIPDNFKKLPWNQLQALAQSLTEDTVGTKAEALQVIREELERRGD